MTKARKQSKKCTYLFLKRERNKTFGVAKYINEMKNAA